MEPLLIGIGSAVPLPRRRPLPGCRGNGGKQQDPSGF